MGGNGDTKLVVGAGGQPIGVYTRRGLHWY
jgi:hypothetical protein